MARYIDVDKIDFSVIKDPAIRIMAKRFILNKPTEDVVPKSEVEQLKRNLEQCENGYRQQMHLLQCKLADAESKVREIFEEIEDVLNNIGCFDEIDFKALKKKYTKESEDTK